MTQQEKILSLMIRRMRTQEWFIASDFMQRDLGELFVGYETNSRLNEIEKMCSFIFEKRKRERFVERRFRFEDLQEILNTLPLHLASWVRHEVNGIL